MGGLCHRASHLPLLVRHFPPSVAASRLAAMDDAKALLDSLMGPSRNVASKEKTGEDFKAKNVCKHYFVGFCVSGWFQNTKREKDPCTKVHSDLLKEEFERHPKHKQLRKEYERDFLRYLESYTSDADSWVIRERRKCRPKGTEVRLPEGMREQYEDMEKQYKDLLQEADTCQSEEAMRKADQMGAMIEAMRKKYTIDFPGEDVCEVCGVRYLLESESNEQGAALAFEHGQGKVHLGFVKIREEIASLKEKMAKEQAEEPEERERSRSRRGARDRNKADNKEGDKGENKDDRDGRGDGRSRRGGRDDDRERDRRRGDGRDDGRDRGRRGGRNDSRDRGRRGGRDEGRDRGGRDSGRDRGRW